MKKYFILPLFLSASLFAENAAPVKREQNLMQTFFMIGLALLFFYFILWRPERKRRKALEQQRSGIKQGDTVIAMGIKGTVVRLEKDTLILKMYDGSKIEMLKTAVTSVEPGSGEAKEAEAQS